jgi:HAD superfamily hydrolase (TIGR01509 family)
VLFDFDGTLTLPESLNLSKIKQQIGCPSDEKILEFIDRLSSETARKKTLEAVNRLELQAAAGAAPNSGAEDLVRHLKAKGLRLGIISRNSRESILRALDNFRLIDAADFDLIITRDDPLSPKPSGDGIATAARRLALPVEEILVVGDDPMDIAAGSRAGALTALLDNRSPSVAKKVQSDFRIDHLGEIKAIVRMGTPLSGGKLPNDLLDNFLKDIGIEDPSLIIRPAVGEDTAVVDIVREEVMVLKTDPITFATDAIGKYSVLVNANDIATSGAVPRWFLATLLFPIGTSAFGIRRIMDELNQVCRQWGITLCGGHTEITDAVTRPVVTGIMAGTVSRAGLVDKRNVRPGDQVVLTKAVAVEGTAIIAREFGERLRSIGMPQKQIQICRGFLEHISILPEASIAAAAEGVSAMHDVTEGGLSTALAELSSAAGHRIRVEMDKIPIYSETLKICGLLKLDPLGLIGSGSLIICCRQYDCKRLTSALLEAGIPAVRIGEVREAGKGVEAFRQRRPCAWPTFEVDEITRLFS